MQRINDNYYVLIIIGMTGCCLLVVFFILLQIRNQNRLLRQQQKMQGNEVHYQKELLKAVIVSQEAERNRIGMDLHDEVSGVLSSLRMIIENFVPDEGSGAVSHDLALQCKQMIDKVIKSVRNIAHNLSPLTGEAYSLPDALEDICDDIRQSEKIMISLLLPAGDILRKLPDTVALALYRVITELFNNTVKHARAENITLAFEVRDDLLLIDYRDDGVGPGKVMGNKGMGMRNIESRLGMIGAEYKRAGEVERGFGLHIKIRLSLTI